MNVARSLLTVKSQCRAAWFAHNLVLDYSRLDFIIDLLGREPKVCRYVLTISYEFCTHRQIVTLSDLIYAVDRVSMSGSGFPGSCTLLLALSISRQAWFGSHSLCLFYYLVVYKHTL
jgi:hypothetical protein